MQKCILVYKDLEHFQNIPQILHCEPYHLIHFSLNLSVAACVKNGNMQVQ